jgi:hypothetical protein
MVVNTTVAQVFDDLARRLLHTIIDTLPPCGAIFRYQTEITLWLRTCNHI